MPNGTIMREFKEIGPSIEKSRLRTLTMFLPEGYPSIHRTLIANGADDSMPIFIYAVEGYTLSVHRNIVRGTVLPAGYPGSG